MARSKIKDKARVCAVSRDRCALQFPDGERTAEITGRFRFDAQTAADYPSVGDWVEAEIISPEFAMIHSLHPRTSVLVRKASGTSVGEQVLAANVDVGFIVTSFNDDFNLRRLERYLALIRQSGITPVIIINKCDLAQSDDTRVAEAEKAAPGISIFRVSSRTGEGVESFVPLLVSGKTGIFLGSSGVGKSSLLNALFGKEVQATQVVRIADAKGRHTTTAREMFSLPQGGFIIDTPGLREISLWAYESVLPEVYTDVAALLGTCQFSDCGHITEPGCAIKTALGNGTLDKERWAAYLKIQKELAFLKRKQDMALPSDNKKYWKKRK